MIDLRRLSAGRRRMCSCPHLKDFKKADGLRVFRKIHAHFVCCGSREARKRKVQFHGRGPAVWNTARLMLMLFLYFSWLKASLCHCHECGTYSSRLHSCLLCVYFGCYIGNRHIHLHAQSTGHSLGTEIIYFRSYFCVSPGHLWTFRFTIILFYSDFLALDLTHGAVYCFVCKDNVYDLDLEKICVEQSFRAWKTLGKIMQCWSVQRKSLIVKLLILCISQIMRRLRANKGNKLIVQLYCSGYNVHIIFYLWWLFTCYV